MDIKRLLALSGQDVPETLVSESVKDGKIEKLIVVIDPLTEEAAVEDVMMVATPEQLYQLIRGGELQGFTLYYSKNRTLAEQDAKRRIEDKQVLAAADRHEEDQFGKADLEDQQMKRIEDEETKHPEDCEMKVREGVNGRYEVISESADAAALMAVASIALGFVPELLDATVFNDSLRGKLKAAYDHLKTKMPGRVAVSEIKQFVDTVEQSIASIDDSQPEHAHIKDTLRKYVDYVKNTPMSKDELKKVEAEMHSALHQLRKPEAAPAPAAVHESTEEPVKMEEGMKQRIKNMVKELDLAITAHEVKYNHHYSENHLDDAANCLRILEVLQQLKHMIKEGKINQATVFYTSVMSPIQDEIPVVVRKFLQLNGQEPKSLKDYFKEVKGA